MEVAAYVGVESFRNGPFILQHVDLHWQKMLLDEECTVVGVIDWEWAQTVPLDSLQLLSFNFASKMLPLQPANVLKHQQISAEFLQALSEMGGASVERRLLYEMLSFQNSPQMQIDRCLHNYD